MRDFSHIINAFLAFGNLILLPIYALIYGVLLIKNMIVRDALAEQSSQVSRISEKLSQLKGLFFPSLLCIMTTRLLAIKITLRMIMTCLFGWAKVWQNEGLKREVKKYEEAVDAGDQAQVFVHKSRIQEKLLKAFASRQDGFEKCFRIENNVVYPYCTSYSAIDSTIDLLRKKIYEDEHKSRWYRPK